MTIVPLLYVSAIVLLILGVLIIVIMLYYAYKEITEDYKNQQDPLNEDDITFIDKPTNQTNS